MSVSDWLAWIGTIGTLGFGGLAVWQFITERAHKSHLFAVKQTLQAMRASCTEAINSEEAIKSEAARQWVRSLAYQLVGVEAHIDAALGIKNV
jgi:hypothetical protein